MLAGSFGFVLVGMGDENNWFFGVTDLGPGQTRLIINDQCHDVLPRNVAGGASAVINSLGALGGFVGTYLVGWVTNITGSPSSSFLLMGVSLVFSLALLSIPVRRS